MDTKTAIVLLSCFVIQETISCPPRDLSIEGEERKCRRSCTSHNNCTAANKGCYCDSECGLSCLNKMSECPEPAGIANGSVTWSRLQWDGRTYYSCHEGYTLIGEGRRRCNADKKWGGKPPACVQGCHRPTDAPSSYPANGEDGFEFGKSYDFFCNTGYYMTGNLTRHCSKNGWSDALFICQLVQCDALRYVENGDIIMSNGYFFGSTASVQCHEGYRSSSPTQAKRCYLTESGSAYGEWAGNLPSCTVIPCDVPVAPNYGSIQDAGYVVLQYGAKIIYQCENGYKLVGSNSSHCNEDGNWGEIPSCVEIKDCVDTFSTMKNGWKSVQGRHASFHCNSMYILIGERKIRCLNDDTWEYRAPYCKEITPDKRVVHDNIEYLVYMDPSLKSNYVDAQSKCRNLDGNIAILYDSQITDKLEEVLTPIEEHHYKLYIALRSELGSEFEWDDSNLRTYLSTSRKNSDYRRWQTGAGSSPDEHECAVIERERPFALNFWTWSFGWMPTRCWEKNYFICQRDFSLCTPNPCENGGTCYVSQKEIFCSCLDGFTGKSCSKEILCHIEDLGSNIITYHKTRNLGIGSKIMIGCNDGYRLVGSDTALCGQNGRWTTPGERCLEIICSRPELSGDILLSESKWIYTAGSQLFFSCPENHRLEGNPSAICGLDGQWSDVAVACIATRCSRPELPDQAYIRENVAEFPSGSFITLDCLSPRTLVGDSKWRCEDGEWLSMNAKCIVRFCKIDLFLLGIGVEVEGFPSSDIMERSFNVSEELTLNCRDGSTHPRHWDRGVSDSNIVCQEGGQWSPNYGGYSCEEES